MIYNIKNDLPANGLKAKSFVQGINVYSPTQGQIGVRQESSSISSKQIFFTFSSPLRTSIIRSLTISVIVFNIYTPSVLYACLLYTSDNPDYEFLRDLLINIAKR